MPSSIWQSFPDKNNLIKINSIKVLVKGLEDTQFGG